MRVFVPSEVLENTTVGERSVGTPSLSTPPSCGVEEVFWACSSFTAELHPASAVRPRTRPAASRRNLPEWACGVMRVPFGVLQGGDPDEVGCRGGCGWGRGWR